MFWKNVLGPAVAALIASSSAFAAEPPIRIGSFVTATGPAAFIGEPEKQVLELFVEKLNKAGGVLGRKVELVLYDDGGAAEKASSFAKRLIQNDNIDLIIGGSLTSTTMAAVPLVETSGIPFISLAGAVVIADPVKKWVFKVPHSDRMAAEKVMTDMKARGLSRLALLSEDSGFGKSGRQQTLEAAKTMGIEIVADETYGIKDTDVTAQLTKIRGMDKAQAVLVFGLGQGPIIATKNYRQLGMSLPLYQSHSVGSKEYIRLAGDAAEGVRLPVTGLVVGEQLSPTDPQKIVVKGFKDEFQKAYKTEPSTFAGYAYDGLQIALAAISRAKSTDKAAVRDEIEKTSGYVGVGGTFTMSPTDHMGLSPNAFLMVEIKNGDWSLIK